MRWALGVEYDGSGFVGWETQRNGPSVQAAVEEALARVAAHPVATVCAGRTDSGVHAWEQVVHFDTAVSRSPRSWTLGANANLPAGISVLWARQVSDDFNARFSALSRRYRYLIYNRPIRLANLRRRMTWWRRPLDVEAMRRAAVHLLGEHDFSAFRASGCQARTPVRTVSRLDVERTGEVVSLDVEANAFLHHMVRNIAGVLMAVGSGRFPPHWARQVLEGRDRRLGGVTAPPTGLYLYAVRYPEKYHLPRVQPSPLVW